MKSRNSWTTAIAFTLATGFGLCSCIYGTFSNENSQDQATDGGLSDSGTSDSHIDAPTDQNTHSDENPDGSNADSNSNSPECTTLSDCPLPTSECVERLCIDHKCGTSIAPPGTIVANQTEGDCQVIVCNETGGIGSIADNNDVPNDDNPCTNDVCTFGAPSNPLKTAGSPCPSGGVCDGAGACVACTVNTHCDLPTECRSWECVKNECVPIDTAAGTPIANQASGDCRKNVCDGAGDWVNIVDDSDIPDDDNSCTNDLCQDGIASHTNVKSGTVCGTESGMSCDGAGTCSNCTDGSQCPGSETFCKTRTCVAGKCGIEYAPKGTALAKTDQAAGNCQEIQCDGSGGEESVEDNTDLPPDTECTIGVCNSGVPGYVNEDSGTPCPSANQCNGAGECVDCLSASDCDGEDTFCASRSCSSAGQCGIDYKPKGTPLNEMEPVAGDCHGPQCDGSGEIETSWGKPCGPGKTCNHIAQCACDDVGQCTAPYLSSGGSHTCGVTAMGAAMCWGSNGNGELGDNSYIDRYVATSVLGLTSDVTTISAGYTSTCAVNKAGGVLCWGANGYGQLGDGTTVRKPIPTPVLGLASEISTVSVGASHACALDNSGTVLCWGRNEFGELGDGSLAQRLTPTPVSGLDSDVISLSVRWEHTCVVTDVGGVLCWGVNDLGQIGDGTNSDRSVPTQVDGLTSGFAAVTAGNKHTCALAVDGEVWCWGSNQERQLRNSGSNSSIPVPALVSMSRPSQPVEITHVL